MKNVLLIIGGPTGSGKTALAIELAEIYKTEIISADSRQCFREMNIGTAKPSNAELSRVKHHFINSHSIHDHFSAGIFAGEASSLLEELFKIHKVVIAVGGTGLYLKALTEGLDQLPQVTPEVRKRVKNIYEAEGLPGLIDIIKSLDVDYLNKVDKNNYARLMRAAEIILSSNKSYSSHLSSPKKKLDFNTMSFVIDLPRELLYERINARVDSMINEGLENEVKGLYPYKSNTSLHTVGYTEFFDYFDGKTTLEKAVELIKQHSRNYAKRQITWFKHQGDYTFLNKDEIRTMILDNIQP